MGPTAQDFLSVGTPFSMSARHVFITNSGSAAPSDFDEKVKEKGGRVLSSHDAIGVVVTTGLSDDEAADIAKGVGQVERDLEVQWIPDESALQVMVAESDAVEAETHKPPASAAFFPFQWNMRIIDADDAWLTKTGVPSVRVAILDTGLDPDHIDQMGLIDVASSRAFIPSLSGPPTWADDNFHGTHVGSIVVSNSIGTSGVAPHVSLIAVKVLGANGRGPFSAIIAGIIHAADVGADVINMSLGATFPKRHGGGPLVAALNRAVNYAHRKDVLVVTSAGNDAEDLQHNGDRIAIPCESGSTNLCISATGPTDDLSSYSNYGTDAIAVASPGGDFGPFATHWVLGPCSSRSVNPGLAACKSRTRYLFVIGTSQAAPHVSGLAALIDSQHGGALNPSQLRQAIEHNAEDLGKPGADPEYGKGRINVCDAVDC
ncbi:MAG: S8 family serine peptidase [Gemmatimonadaceae bacterium]